MGQKNEIYSDPIQVNWMKDLTHEVYKGNKPIVIGREKELCRIMDILCKKNKNNPVLIGQPGVGKTTLVYALAEKLVNNKVSGKLKNYYILEIDMLALIAGAKYRGEYEEKVKAMFDRVMTIVEKRDKKIIICIDEIHTIVGAGAAEGALDLSYILKPFLLNSSVKIIGTSTFKEYRIIESDKALERRFDAVKINEPSFYETIQILTGLKSSLEEFHGVAIQSSTIETVINVSERYIPERFLPDKAIDLLDEACAIKANSYRDSDSTIVPEDIFLAISAKKNIPIGKVQDADNLMKLEEMLISKVIGQEHVCSSIAKAIRRTKAGLNDENKPLASFMFVGPTGVGKTETAKALADLVFYGKDKIIRFDMSEYMEEQSVSKLIGAPPGYVGYKESGLLTEQVRRNPYSLVLFDEFEKAHYKICNILLQILDEGCLTDSKGEHINFKNTIIILTSNVGVSELSKKSVGFTTEEQSSTISKGVLTAVKKKFSPEFLNRIDEIIQFNYLSKEAIFKIAKLYISNLIDKVNNYNIRIDISDDVIFKVAQLGYKQEYGARELHRTIEREIKNPLADMILQNNNVDYFCVELVNGQIKISPKVKISI